MKVFITGGTTGIGEALARIYLAEGHDVAVCGRDLQKLTLDLKNHPKLKSFQLSVTDREAIIAAVREFAPEGLDLLIANAGVSVGRKSPHLNFEDARRLTDINIYGVLNSFEAALPAMLSKKSGHLVAIGSVAGMMGLPGAGPYCASKAWVLKMCESMQLDLKGQGVAVTAVAPGFIDTPLTRKNDHAMPFLMTREEAAQRIKKAIDKKKPLFIFPLRMRIIVTFLELMPRTLYRFLMSFKTLNYSRK